MKREKEIIIFGGSFNPPTVAHQAIVSACLQQPDFDEVWVMPSAERKDKAIDTHHDHRIAMLELMNRELFSEHVERLHISDLELQLPAPTQTAKTVGALAMRYSKARFWFVYGADSYANMHTWSGGAELRETLPVLLVPRIGNVLPPTSARVRHLAIDADELPDISSTMVRKRVAAQQPAIGMVCEPVREYIEANNLYAGS